MGASSAKDCYNTFMYGNPSTQEHELVQELYECLMRGESTAQVKADAFTNLSLSASLLKQATCMPLYKPHQAALLKEVKEVIHNHKKLRKTLDITRQCY